MFQINASPAVANTTVKLLLLTGLLALQGCSQEIDARQARVEQGLIYKKDASDPFSGTLTNVGPTEIGREYGVQFLPFDGGCAVPVKNGMFDGVVSCKNSMGKKVAEVSYRSGHQDGTLKVWSADSGNLVLSMAMHMGFADGLMEKFNSENGKIVSRINYVKGKEGQEGEEKKWDSSGENLVVDLTWTGGRKTGYTKTEDLEENYKDGFTEGISKTYKKSQTGGKRYLESEANYIHGTLEGKKTHWDEVGNVIFSQIYRNGIIQSQTKQRWQDGKIVFTESAVNVSSDGTDDREIALKKDGKEHTAYEYQGTFFICDVDWQKGKAIRGTFEERKHDKVVAIYNGVTNPDGENLVKDGVEKRWDDSGNLVLEVKWNKGVALKMMSRSSDGQVFNTEHPGSDMNELQRQIGTDSFAKGYL